MGPGLNFKQCREGMSALKPAWGELTGPGMIQESPGPSVRTSR
jgi:hypothetical protein